jgi:glycine betaine/proline transport system ATP-binding protein
MQEEFLRIQRQLKKTIIFITHDFDEAIRLADRIAIMKDGAVVQVATPEELVLAPANDYVAAFTAHVTRAKVVTLGRIAAAGVPDGIAGTLSAEDRIEDVAERIVTADAPFAVERDDQVIGHVTPQAVISVLIGKRT